MSLRWRPLLFAALGVLLSPASRAEIDDGQFRSTIWGVSLVAPKSWQLSERTSYPNILLWMSLRETDSKMLLTAEKVAPDLDALTYARRTKAILESMKFTVRAPLSHAPTGAYWADFDDGSSYLRQAYLTRDGVGFTLTLSAPSSRLRNQHLRAFDSALRSLQFFERQSEAPTVIPEDDP